VKAAGVPQCGLAARLRLGRSQLVPSVRGDLILTAAHCLGRRLAATLMFAPSYRGECAPFGEWHVTGQRRYWPAMSPEAAACLRIQDGGWPDSAAIACQLQPAALRSAR
jgi:hypothetical protein